MCCIVFTRFSFIFLLLFSFFFAFNLSRNLHRTHLNDNNRRNRMPAFAAIFQYCANYAPRVLLFHRPFRVKTTLAQASARNYASMHDSNQFIKGAKNALRLHLCENRSYLTTTQIFLFLKDIQ